jgi:hypothetical protein
MVRSTIFLKELFAVTRFFETFADERGLPHLHDYRFTIAVDNTAVAHVLRRGLSSVADANALLQRVYDKVRPEAIRVVTIPSRENAADPLTRHRPLCEQRNADSWNALVRSESGADRQTFNPNAYVPTEEDEFFRHREEDAIFDGLFPENSAEYAQDDDANAADDDDADELTVILKRPRE